MPVSATLSLDLRASTRQPAAVRLWLIVLLFFAAPARAAPDSAPRIADAAAFDALSRVSDGGRYARLANVMFVIDRAAQPGPRVYFIHSRRHQFHIEFIQRSYLSTQSTDALLASVYARPDRRFVAGSVVRYPDGANYGVEFWEGDVLDVALLTETMAALRPAFFAPLAFKPNSQGQLDLARSMTGLAVIEPEMLAAGRTALVLNPGRAIGRLRILAAPAADLGPGDIVVLDEVPLRLSPVAGLITTVPSTPLSHVNLLAKSWRVPNAYRRDAARAFAALDGQMVVLDARGDTVAVRLATPAERTAAARTSAWRSARIARADLTYRVLPGLAELKAGDVIRVGAKAANLGEVARRAAREAAPDFSVPPGFAIPFAYYEDFLRANGLDRQIDALLADPGLLAPARRRAALADLRAAFAHAPFPSALLDQIDMRRASLLGPGGVFVRSSTNSEDLKGFNGAGLYATVPNVVGRAALADAVRTVWASVWSDAAFDARTAAGIDHRSVKAAVLVQRGMDASAAGVLITTNPFDPREPDAVFINAKRGLGIRVVEGRRVAEQLLYRADPESIQLLTRSNDDAMLQFDAAGGVREIPVEPGRAVLTDALARRLARIGRRIAGWFGGHAQDVEWLTIGETIHIVQSRPYLTGS